MSSQKDKPLSRAKAARLLEVLPAALPEAVWSTGWVRAVRRERPRPQWLAEARRELRRVREEEAREREALEMEREEDAVRQVREAPSGPPAPHRPRAVGWVSVPMLRARGWTDAAIRDFLPPAEHTRANPHFSSAGAPQRLWSPAMVGRAEASEEWQAWLEKSLTRRKTTLAALAYPTDDEDFLAKLQRVQDAIDAAADVHRVSRQPVV